MGLCHSSSEDPAAERKRQQQRDKEEWEAELERKANPKPITSEDGKLTVKPHDRTSIVAAPTKINNIGLKNDPSLCEIEVLTRFVVKKAISNGIGTLVMIKYPILVCNNTTSVATTTADTDVIDDEIINYVSNFTQTIIITSLSTIDNNTTTTIIEAEVITNDNDDIIKQDENNNNQIDQNVIVIDESIDTNQTDGTPINEEEQQPITIHNDEEIELFATNVTTQIISTAINTTEITTTNDNDQESKRDEVVEKSIPNDNEINTYTETILNSIITNTILSIQDDQQQQEQESPQQDPSQQDSIENDDNNVEVTSYSQQITTNIISNAITSIDDIQQDQQQSQRQQDEEQKVESKVEDKIIYPPYSIHILTSSLESIYNTIQTAINYSSMYQSAIQNTESHFFGLFSIQQSQLNTFNNDILPTLLTNTQLQTNAMKDYCIVNIISDDNNNTEDDFTTSIQSIQTYLSTIFNHIIIINQSPSNTSQFTFIQQFINNLHTHVKLFTHNERYTSNHNNPFTSYQLSIQHIYNTIATLTYEQMSSQQQQDNNDFTNTIHTTFQELFNQ